MARRTRKRSKSTDGTAAAKASSNLHAALDPLSALLKGAGLRRSEPAEMSPSPPSRPKKIAPARAAAPKPSALAVPFPDMPGLKGLRLATASAGIAAPGTRDLLVVTFPPKTQVAGVFSRSKTPGAPVDWCRRALDNESPEARVLVVHAGNANAFTGKFGDDAAKEIAAAAAKAAKCRQRDVFMAGTGVIGERLPVHKVSSKLPAMIRGGSSRPWLLAARSIMVTDTFPKGATRVAKIDDVSVTLNGIAKGSRMVSPDLATVLGFVCTDAEIPSDILQGLLLLAVRESFGAISIDGDMSPNDTVMAFASGQVALKTPVTRLGDRRLADFRRKLTDLMKDLSRQIVSDGDGAKKLIKVMVTGAASAAAAGVIARAIANSPLVKLSIGAEEPNWGRIIAAVGKSGEAADRDKLNLTINDVYVAKNGEAHPDFVPAALAEALKAKEVRVSVDVGVGRGVGSVWTCDLSQRYIALSTSNRS